LADGQPQVFAMKLTSEGAFSSNPMQEIDLMQNWAQVRGGYFQYVTGFGSLSKGFDRAIAWLKRPVDFRVAVNFAQVDAPAPASLQLIAGVDGAAAAAQGAVAIILDASGSMLKRMDGQRRIDIAKAAIERSVEQTLPEGLPLALRVYGHREAGSCRTDLEIPLTPLDKSAFLSQLEPIEAINLARTPIADSIRAVRQDLSAASGRKLVVLLTDGEETCEGDPAAAIDSLQAAGLDVRVNIVGFAIDDDALKSQFATWAQLGGGDYLDAADAEGLNAALAQSLQQPFSVLGSDGMVQAEGVVGGEPIVLPPGRYRLVVETPSGQRKLEISLNPAEQRVLNLSEE
ncbi:MAG: VWA domain-containing protein, partial [Pseudomonadota bacterium]